MEKPKNTKQKETGSKSEAPKQKSKKKLVPEGIIHVHASFNNTIVTVTDPEGNCVASCSSGVVGFSGTKGSTAFAAAKSAENIVEKLQKVGMKEAKVYIKGPGQGRNSAVKSLAAAGINITVLSDITPIPHNGCRQRKAPRK
ncbi:30S ribosomal protein S11 [Candidatus Dojkabacteria bacterium]|nr:30S ribosomal protein S11 [Candidatus Dojkabacteria bacterium]